VSRTTSDVCNGAIFINQDIISQLLDQILLRRAAQPTDFAVCFNLCWCWRPQEICATGGKNAGAAHMDPNVVVFPKTYTEIRVPNITKEFA
jgi:hypothetical protein